MWIQRSPGASTISARASSRSGWAATVWARERTMRRPILGLGRLGMARTEWIVGRRHRPRDLTVGCSAHSSTHPEGGRDWPCEPPPTIPPPGAETVAIPIRLQDDGLGDAVKGTLLAATPPTASNPGGGFTTCRQMP